MKRVRQGIAAIVFALVVAPSSIVHAAAPETLITGYVFKDNAPLSTMTVIASCGRYFADADVTDATGAYLTSFPISECGWGSDVELLAISSTDVATARGTTYKVTSKLNVANTMIFVK